MDVTVSRPVSVLRPTFDGLGLGLEDSGLGLEPSGLGLGLEPCGLGLGLGLEGSGLINIPAKWRSRCTHRENFHGRICNGLLHCVTFHET